MKKLLIILFLIPFALWGQVPGIGGMIFAQEQTVDGLVKYGSLYNWYACVDTRKISSSDAWIVPTYAQYQALRTYTGGADIGGAEVKETGTIYWNDPNIGATNSTGWTGRGSGYRSGITGEFEALKGGGYYFSTYSSGSNSAVLSINSSTIAFALITFPKTHGASLRLTSIASGVPDGTVTTYTGNDLKVYKAVAINGVYWLSESLAETKFRNGDTISTVTDNAAWVGLGTSPAKCSYNNDESNILLP